MKFSLDIGAFLNSLPIMGKGMMGIFAVTVIIAVTMVILGKLSNKKN